MAVTPHNTVKTSLSGGQIQGVASAGSVVIENFKIYNYAEAEQAVADDKSAPPCPYPGLAYFGPADSSLFFGRDAAIGRLTEAIGRQSFTALIGASGSGKSSVVLAGLAPRLADLGGWRFSHFRVGTELDRDPFLALARALVPLFSAAQDDVERLTITKKLGAMLQAGDLTLRDVFADGRARQKGSRILLIADQFEEIFTLVQSEALRHRFIDVLLEGFPDPAPGGVPDICLIVTLRADFYGRALLHRPLADALQNHVENLGPMSRTELQLAIETPAENTDVHFESGLVATLLDDVESKPGSLPLLQFALRELWGLQEKRKITRKNYDSVGGVQGALARRAETIFAEMTENGTNQEVAADFQRLFIRLVTPGEGQADTRRIAERRELGGEVWSLAQRLAGEANRLVVTNAIGPSHETAEVVHEALIRNWPTLAGWINRDRAFLSWLRQIKSSVDTWSADPSDDGPLLRGGMLGQARDWLARRRDDLSAAEHRFIEASLALRQRAEEEQEAARQAEIRHQQELAEAAVKIAKEQKRLARIAVVGGLIASGFAVVAIFAGNAAYTAKSRADEAANLAIQERDLATFAVDTMKRISGAAFSKAAELASVAEKAVASNSLEDRVEAYDQFALYHNDAGDWERGRRAIRKAGELSLGISDPVSRAHHREVSGDLMWGGPASALGEYAAALILLESAKAPAVDRARILRKMAIAMIDQDRLDQAAQKISEAASLLTGDSDSPERAFLSFVSGDIEVARHNEPAAIEAFKDAIIRFNSRFRSNPRDLLVGLTLGQTLQMMGDAERKLGLPHAFQSYDEAIRALDSVLAEDPTLLDALRSRELSRRGLRLMKMTDRYDTAKLSASAQAKSDFEAAFGSGIGKFRFGMTPTEVNRLLKPPFDEATIAALDRAWEYTTSDIRYLCRWFGDSPPAGVGCGAGIPAEDLTLLLFPKAPECMLNKGYAVFMFSENDLFRIVFRFYNDSDPCPARMQGIDEFAVRYGITSSGGHGTRRLQYETDTVGLVANSDDNVVAFDFEQR